MFKRSIISQFLLSFSTTHITDCDSLACWITFNPNAWATHFGLGKLLEISMIILQPVIVPSNEWLKRKPRNIT